MTNTSNLNPAQTWALVVAIESYPQYPSLNLDGPYSDARDFIQWLRSRQVRPEHIVLLGAPLQKDERRCEDLEGVKRLSKDPVTQDAIEEALFQFRDKSGLLILFWSGHGIMTANRIRRPLFGNYSVANKKNLNVESLQEHLRSIQYKYPKMQLLIFDICGTMFDELYHGERLPDVSFQIYPAAPQCQQVLFFASADGQVAENVTLERTGLYYRELSQILKQQNGWPPDTDEVHRLVEKRFVDLEKKGCTRQSPIFYVYHSGWGPKYERYFGKVTSDATWLEGHLQREQNAFVKYIQHDETLTHEQAADRYVELLVQECEQSARQQSARKKPREGALSEFVQNAGAPVLVFGEGGAGKTTSLLKLAADAAEQALADPTQPIPFYIRLSGFDTQQKGFDRLLTLLSNASRLDPAGLKELWRTGDHPCFFFLDGFNEVREEFQGTCASALDEFMGSGPHRYVVTSRRTAQTERLLLPLRSSSVLPLDIVHLDEGRIRDFLVRHNAAGLYDRMGDALKGLVRTPFLLWALAQSCSGLPAGELPRNIGQLYQRLMDHYIFHEKCGRERKKNPSPTEYNYFRVKKPVLAQLAFSMTRKGIIRCQENLSLLEAVRDQLQAIPAKYDGLIPFKPYELMPDPPDAKTLLDEIVHNGVLRRVGDALEFMHESVQDYFAAVYLLKLLNDEHDELRCCLRHDAWDEAVVLLSGLTSQLDRLVNTLIPLDPFLAARCSGSRSQPKDISPETAKQLVDRLARLIEYSFSPWQEKAIAALGDSGLEAAVPELCSFLKNYGEWICCQAIEALGRLAIDIQEMNRKFENPNSGCGWDFQLRFPEANLGLDSRLSSPVQANPAVQDIVLTPAVQDIVLTLIKALEAKNKSVQRAAVKALQGLRWPTVVQAMLERLGSPREDVRQAAMQALIGIQTREVIPALKEQLQDDDTSESRRRMAVQALWELNAREEAIPALIERLKRDDETEGMQYEVAKALEAFGAHEAVFVLLNQVLHAKGDAFYAAAVAVWSLGRDDALSALQAWLHDTDESVRLRACEVLGIGHALEALPWLKKRMQKDDSVRVRAEAVRALMVLRATEAISDLIEQLKKEGETVRLAIVKALRRLDEARIASAVFIELLRDPSEPIRREAVETIREWAVPEAVDALIECVKKDESPSVRELSIDGLRVLGAREAIPVLIEQLQHDTGALVRRKVAATLVEWQAQEAIPALVESLWDSDEWVCKEIERGLSGWARAHAIPLLLERLQDPDEVVSVRLEAVNILERLGAKEAIPHLRKLLTADDCSILCEFAARALGELKAQEAIPDLVACVCDASENNWVRACAVEALAGLQAREEASMLIDQLHSESEVVRRVAAQALTILETEKAIPHLIKRLRDPSVNVQLAVIEAIIQLRAQAAIPHLIECLGHDNWKVRRSVARGLGGLCAQEAIPSLVSRLRDEKAEVRDAAAHALLQIRPPVAVPALMEQLQDKVPGVVWHAADALKALDASEVARVAVLFHLAAGGREVRELLQQLPPRVLLPVLDGLLSYPDGGWREFLLQLYQDVRRALRMPRTERVFALWVSEPSQALNGRSALWKAVSLTNEALALAPGWFWIARFKANTLCRLGCIEAALAALPAGMDHPGDIVIVELDRASFLIQQGRPEEALSTVRRIQADYPAFLVRCVDLLEVLGQDDEAEAIYKRCIQFIQSHNGPRDNQEYFDYWNSHRNVGLMYLRQGRVEEAEGYIHQAARNSPSEVIAYRLWGRLHLAKGELDDAFWFFSEVAKREADDTHDQYLLAFVNVRLGNVEEAMSILEKALAYTELPGQVDGALHELDALISANPDLPELDRIRERILARKAELRQLAEEEYERECQQ